MSVFRPNLIVDHLTGSIQFVVDPRNTADKADARKAALFSTVRQSVANQAALFPKIAGQLNPALGPAVSEAVFAASSPVTAPCSTRVFTFALATTAFGPSIGITRLMDGFDAEGLATAILNSVKRPHQVKSMSCPAALRNSRTARGLAFSLPGANVVSEFLIRGRCIKSGHRDCHGGAPAKPQKDRPCSPHATLRRSSIKSASFCRKENRWLRLANSTASQTRQLFGVGAMATTRWPAAYVRRARSAITRLQNKAWPLPSPLLSTAQKTLRRLASPLTQCAGSSASFRTPSATSLSLRGL